MIYDGSQQFAQQMGMPNPAMGNAFIPQGTGMQFNGFGQPQQVQNNILSAEEINQLVKKENQFSLALTETDKLRSKCNHRTADGLHDALYEEENGFVRCGICGYTFRPLDSNTSITTKEALQATVNEMIDILQTIKMIWIDVNPEAASEYFQIIPLLEKAPELFKVAADNFARHGAMNPWLNNNYNMNTMQLFNMLSGIINGQAPVYGQQVPNMNMGMGSPMMGGVQPQAPFGAPGMGMGVPNPSNGFGFVGNTPMNYQAQTTDYQTNYGNPDVAQQAVTVPVTDVTDNKTTESFKA